VIETEIGEGWSMPADSKAIMRALVDPSHDEMIERYRHAFSLQPKQAQILALMMDRPAITASGLRDIVKSFDAARWHVQQIRYALSPINVTVSSSFGRWSLCDSSKQAIRTNLLTTPNAFSVVE